MSEWERKQAFSFFRLGAAQQKTHGFYLLCATYVKKKVELVFFDKLSSDSLTLNLVSRPAQLIFSSQIIRDATPFAVPFKMCGDFGINELLSRVVALWEIFDVKCFRVAFK